MTNNQVVDDLCPPGTYETRMSREMLFLLLNQAEARGRAAGLMEAASLARGAGVLWKNCRERNVTAFAIEADIRELIPLGSQLKEKD